MDVEEHPEGLEEGGLNVIQYAVLEGAELGDLQEVTRLVDQFPDLVHTQDPLDGRTPLLKSSSKGHFLVARFLIDMGSDVNHVDASGCTVLWNACEHDRPWIVRLLLERGADPCLRSRDGCTPLMEAGWRGYTNVVACLLTHPHAHAGLDAVDKYGRSALWWASARGQKAVVQLLLEHHADFTLASKFARTPLSVAKGAYHDSCAALLQAAEDERERVLLLCKGRLCSEVCSANANPQALSKALPPFLRHRVRASHDNITAKNNHAPAGAWGCVPLLQLNAPAACMGHCLAPTLTYVTHHMQPDLFIELLGFLERHRRTTG